MRLIRLVLVRAHGDLERELLVRDPAPVNRRPIHPPVSGLATARMIAMCSYRSPHAFDTRFGRQHTNGSYTAQTYLHHHGAQLVERFDANTYLTVIDAMDTHEVDPSTITTPAPVIGISSDVLYPEGEVRALAAALPNAEYSRLAAPHGHDTFLIETPQLNQLVTTFRKRLVHCWKPTRRHTAARGVAWA